MIRKAFIITCLLFSQVFAIFADNKPNILMICIDDLNDWIGCLGGHPDAITPHIDQLANEGRNFTNAHCVVPVCSPSRVSVMSGVDATTHGSYELGPSYMSIPHLQNVPCMQEYFQAQGYKTFSGGKVLHSGFKGPLQKFIDVTLEGGKGPRPKKFLNWPGKAWDWGVFPETDEEVGDYQVAQSAAEALKAKHDQPFFMSVGIFRPHVPLLAPQKWFDLYDREKIKLPNDSDEDLADLPPNFLGRMNIEPVHGEIVERGIWRDMVHAYLACISFADMCVGTIMEGLNEGPNKDNTLVVLWSDHGFHLGEKQKWAKRTLWEESTRTPLIIAGPGIQPGPCHEAVSLLDIYPTMVDYCRTESNPHLEGLSLTPWLNNPKLPREKPVLSTSFYGNHAIRTRDWRYIRYIDGAEELYDHRKDPEEFSNLALSPEYKSKKEELAKWLPKSIAKEVRGASSKAPKLKK